jgi:DNA-binding Lrp family transcriptional regulator
VAKIAVSNTRELDRLVMEKIHSLEAIESTRTFITVSGLRWTR